MGSWVDSEQGQKVVDGVPASYYGTFQGQGASYPPQQYTQAPSAPTYPPASSGTYPPASSGIYPPASSGGISYPVISDSQVRYQDYSRPAWGTQQYQRNDRLPFCNLGYGWFLFILGFLLVVPWYVGALLLVCLAHDERERGGLVACTVASVVMILAGGTRHMYHRW